MKVAELFEDKLLSRDAVMKRMQNAKSSEERRKWAMYLVRNRYAYYMTEETLSAYSDRLVKTLNIKRLGSGAYAHVFQHPEFPNVVVKVFTNKDKVYKRYAAWCMKHQSNKYVPKIIEIVPFKSESGDSYNIAFMEKMTPMRNSTFNAWTKSITGDAGLKAIDDYDYDKLFKLFVKGMKASTDADLKAVMDHIFSYGQGMFDVHAGNVMRRGTQIVFTDPVGDAPVTRVDGYGQ